MSARISTSSPASAVSHSQPELMALEPSRSVSAKSSCVRIECPQCRRILRMSRRKFYSPRQGSWCKQCIRDWKRIEYLRKRDQIKARVKTYRRTNKPKIRSLQRAYVKRRTARDPSFRILSNHRRRINSALSGKGNQFSSIRILGCSAEEFRLHLQSLFEVGMSWDNYGTDWEIDHIRPCSSFDFTDERQAAACFHFSNQQPLWKTSNRSKGAKFNANSR